MKIIEVNTINDFLNLEEQWKNLLDYCDHSVFSTWEWVSTWWRHFGKSKHLSVLLAVDNGEIIGLVPLMRSSHSFIDFRGKIEFIGTPHSDYHDFLIKERENECVKMFFDYLRYSSPKGSAVELNEISEDSNFVKSLKEAPVILEQLTKCPYILLPKTYDAFMNGLGRNLRANIRRNSRRLEKAFKVEFIDSSDDATCTDGMRWFFKLHQIRSTQKGQKGFFADPAFCNFHLDIAQLFAKKGWLRLFLIKLSEKPVAAVYGFKYQQKFLFYLQGFDPHFSKYSVGNQLTAYAVRKCIEDKLTVFDFMRGADIYKDRWTKYSKWNFRVTFSKKTLFSSFRSSICRRCLSIFKRSCFV